MLYRISRKGRQHYRALLERAWSEHWPVRRQREFVEALEPGMRRIVVLRPARVEALEEHGRSRFSLDRFLKMDGYNLGVINIRGPGS